MLVLYILSVAAIFFDNLCNFFYVSLQIWHTMDTVNDREWTATVMECRHLREYVKRI